MKVAITGATGLLGHHILMRMTEAGVPVVALHRAGKENDLPGNVTRKQADLLDPVSLSEAFEGVDTVIHSAAFVSFHPGRRKEILNVNVNGTHQVVNACLQAGVKNLVYISSVSALGRKSGAVTNEDSTWTGADASDYAESKYLGELEVYRGAEEGLNVSMVNPSVILSASVLSRSSATLFDYVWNEKRFYTDGALNYVDARDVAEAVLRLCETPRPGEKFILSAGHLPLRDFFSKTAKKMNKRAPSIRISSALAWWVGWLEEMRAGIFNREPVVTRLTARLAVQSFQYDHSKATNVLGIQFRPLDATLDWCCEEYARNVKPNN